LDDRCLKGFSWTQVFGEDFWDGRGWTGLFGGGCTGLLSPVSGDWGHIAEARRMLEGVGVGGGWREIGRPLTKKNDPGGFLDPAFF
jgi:hypothetical protein